VTSRAGAIENLGANFKKALKKVASTFPYIGPDAERVAAECRFIYSPDLRWPPDASQLEQILERPPPG
jgi:hypothetical protein